MNGCLIMALPADGVPVFSGLVHVVAVTISGGPFLPCLTAGLHQFLGRHCIVTQILSSRFITFSAASVSKDSHEGSAGRERLNIYQHRIPSVRCCKITGYLNWNWISLWHSCPRSWFWWLRIESKIYVFLDSALTLTSMRPNTLQNGFQI